MLRFSLPAMYSITYDPQCLHFLSTSLLRSTIPPVR
jgi:hypothetical protein